MQISCKYILSKMYAVIVLILVCSLKFYLRNKVLMVLEKLDIWGKFISMIYRPGKVLEIFIMKKMSSYVKL